MTGSWRLFLLFSLLQGAGCNAAEFKVLVPASVMTLSGSCVTVPCSFILRDGYDAWLNPECGKYWYKMTYQPISSTTFRGDLTAYNCTTTFNNVHEDNVKYYFRIQCDGSALKYNFYENPVTIRIKGLPDAPRLTPPKEPVVEGTPVELGCSAPSYCDIHPPTVTWTPALGLSTQLQQNDTVTSTLTFNAALLHHGNNVSCTAAYYIPSGNKTVTSTRYQLSILSPPRILSSSGCSRIAAWVRCSCDSVGRPSPSLEWRLDGKLVLGSEEVSVCQVNLENATLRSSLTMRAPAGLTALTCHSSNAAGNTSQELPVPHLETQPNLADSDQLPWIAATAVLAAGLLFATVCALRAWKMANQTRLGNNALINHAQSHQGNTQVCFKCGEDIYANIDKLMNTVGPREEPVGAGEEAAGLGEGAVGRGVEAVGLGEGAVTAAGSSALTQRDAEEAADPAPDRQVADCDVLYTTVNWKKKSKKKDI
ncbi:unnamed protein product [Gadus morhua 'NCC']